MNLNFERTLKICDYIIKSLKNDYIIYGVWVRRIKILKRRNLKKWTCHTCGKIMPKGYT